MAQKWRPSFVSGDLFLQLFRGGGVQYSTQINSTYFKNNLNLSEIFCQSCWDGHFLQCPPPPPPPPPGWRHEGAGLVVVGSITALAGDAVAHTGLEELPAYLLVIIERWPGFSTAARQQLQCTAEICAAPPRPGASDRADTQGAASAAESAPLGGRSGAQRSGAVHEFSTSSSGGGKQTTQSRDTSSSGTIRDFSMASKSVGLFVLFHLVVLSVVSRSSAFPTPTASADGEWDVGTQLTFTVVVLKCYCRKPTASVKILKEI